MEKAKCNNCSAELREDMDIYYSENMCQLFCSKKCVKEYFIREMGICKVNVKNIRDYNKFDYVADGYLYKTDLDDDVCQNCKDGIYNFYKFEKLDGNRYEVYKCSDCGNEVRIKCK